MIIKTIIARALLFSVRCYQLFISPVIPSACRYLPSCSAYAIEAIRRHGPFRGVCLTIKRLLRCHPWGGHGLDLVPDARKD